MNFETDLNKVWEGDCRVLLKDIPDNSIDLIVTDPPFFISQEGKVIGRKGVDGQNMDIKLDFGKWDKFADQDEFFKFTESWFKECVRVMKPKAWIYVFFDKHKIGYFDLILAPKYDMKAKNVFIWCKTNPGISYRKVNWVSGTEFIWVGSKGESKMKHYLKQSEMMSYMITPNKSSYGQTTHPTEKPEKLIHRLVITGSNEGDLVLDPFMGSGTTGAVCEKLKRKWIGCERDEGYIKIAKERIETIKNQGLLF